MIINLAEKYDNNITKQYGHRSFASSNLLTAQEKAMWRLVLWILKDNYPKTVFDTEADAKYLNEYMKLFFAATKDDPFTLEEWSRFLVSR